MKEKPKHTSKRKVEPASGLLSEREREILRVVVDSFVKTAGPVGSRFLAKNYSIGLSAASIRNTMSDLEAQGLLEHPYTSSGRVPTELGYRTFVNQLMDSHALTRAEKKLLSDELDRIVGDTEEILAESSRVLGSLTSLLGVVLTPKMSTGVLERLDVVKLSATRVMFVISVRGGLVRTIVFRVELEIKKPALDRVVSLLNERLAGLSLQDIRDSFRERIADVDDVTGIVQMTLKESGNLFSEVPEADRVRYGNTFDIMSQPEFQEPEDLRALIELIEDKDTVVNVIEDKHIDELTGLGHAAISIGSESGSMEGAISRYSLVTAQYQLGQSIGTIGVIGPKRMDYGRIVSLVEGVAKLLSNSSYS